MPVKKQCDPLGHASILTYAPASMVLGAVSAAVHRFPHVVIFTMSNAAPGLAIRPGIGLTLMRRRTRACRVGIKRREETRPENSLLMHPVFQQVEV